MTEKQKQSSENYSEAWSTAVQEASASFNDSHVFTGIKPIYLKDHTAAEVVQGFVRVAEQLKGLDKHDSKISLRTLSARCFWGDSKVLDNRRSFLEAAFPGASEKIKPRSIMMSVYIPQTIKVALFIENFDSFLSTVNAVKKSNYKDQIAIIYSAGFRGSADVIRETGNVQFVTINHSEATAYQHFEDWWYCRKPRLTATEPVSCYFWGDLDFSGMAILKALRVRFPNITAWQKAYEAIVCHHEQGARHSAKGAEKQQQCDPQSTGCKTFKGTPNRRNDGLDMTSNKV